MNLFKQGKKPFLEFLRNITTQSAILALALFAGRGLDPNSCCDMGNAEKTFLFLILLTIFLCAWVASSIQFLEDYLYPPGRHRNMYERLRAPRHPWKHLFVYTWRRNRSLIPESVIVIFLVQMSLFMVSAQAVFMATGFMQVMKN